ASNAMWCSVQTTVSKIQWLKISSRQIYCLLLAFPAGLALANLLAAAMAILLFNAGMEQSEAMTLSLLLAYLAMPCWMLWIYCTSSLAWLSAKGLLFGLLCAIVIYFPW
uniref:hypothetical protein n=1 Tax=uncultured Limnobacter sp. TaxID=199681 RepID=UPI0030F9D6A5